MKQTPDGVLRRTHAETGPSGGCTTGQGDPSTCRFVRLSGCSRRMAVTRRLARYVSASPRLACGQSLLHRAWAVPGLLRRKHLLVLVPCAEHNL